MKHQSSIHYDAIPMLTIGKLSAVIGNISSDALRYYEREGLLAPTSRTEGGYRLYGDDAVQRVRFIQHAQACGFTLTEIRELLKLRQLSNVRCGDIKRRIIEKRLQINEKIGEMQTMAEALDRIIDQCVDEEKSVDDCPMLIIFGR